MQYTQGCYDMRYHNVAYYNVWNNNKLLLT